MERCANTMFMISCLQIIKQFLARKLRKIVNSVLSQVWIESLLNGKFWKIVDLSSNEFLQEWKIFQGD